MPNKRYLMRRLAKLFDICCVSIAIVVATIAARPSPEGVTLAGFLAMRIKLSNGLFFLLLLVLWHVLFVSRGLYVSQRLISWRAQISEISQATLIASAFLPVAARVFHPSLLKLDFTIVFWLCSTVVMTAGRLAFRPLFTFLRSRGRNSRFLLIVGTNSRALEFAQSMMSRPELGYTIVGFADDDWMGINVFDGSGHKRCCRLDGLRQFLRSNVVDEVAIYLPLRSYYEHVAQLVALCEEHGVAIRFDSKIFRLKSQQLQMFDFDEQTQVFSGGGSAQLFPAMIKRSLDLVFSVALLLLLSPLLAVIAVLVKLSSPGPILFRQTRVGLNKRQFEMYKFRTMVINAEKMQNHLLALNEMSGPVFKITNDPRITPLGRILRKTSLDELPQLFNVLVGDMSLVGPRAMSLRDYQLFEHDCHRRRFSVKPGITCLWQIRGRNSIPFEQWMELDMQYIDKWSLWLDLQILARTVPVVLRGTGAA